MEKMSTQVIKRLHGSTMSLKIIIKSVIAVLLFSSISLGATWLNNGEPKFTQFKSMIGSSAWYGGANGYAYVQVVGDPNNYYYSLDLSDPGQRAMYATLLFVISNGYKFDILYDLNNSQNPQFPRLLNIEWTP